MLTFIDDEHLDALPLGLGRLVPHDVADELIRRADAKSDPSERMDGRPADVARGHARRSRDGDGVPTAAVLALEGADDLTQEDRFSSSCAVEGNARASQRCKGERSRDTTKVNAPAEPVKKTFLPSSTTSLRTTCCSGLRTTFCLMSSESLCKSLPFISDEILLLFPFAAPAGPLSSWKFLEPVRGPRVEDASSSSHGKDRFRGKAEPFEAAVAGLLSAKMLDPLAIRLSDALEDIGREVDEEAAEEDEAVGRCLEKSGARGRSTIGCDALAGSD